MSSAPLRVHPPIYNKGPRKNKAKREERHPIPSRASGLEEPWTRRTRLAARHPLSDIAQGFSIMNAHLAPPADRIYSTISPGQNITRPPTPVPTSRARPSVYREQENVLAFQSGARPVAPLFHRPSNEQDHTRIPRLRRGKRPTILQTSNEPGSTGPVKVVFSESLLSEPARSAEPSLRTRPLSPFRVNKRTALPLRHESFYFSTQELPGKPRARFDDFAPRYPQGHRISSRPSAKAASTSRVQPEAAVAKELKAHIKETATAISNLDSQVGSLNTSMAAVLPIVAEARLLWMENTVVRASTKLGTTRQAFCQYYDNPRYLTYTGNVRARAHILGFSLHDLKYLQERLGSLGEEYLDQRTAREAVLLSPFGGGNESGDRIMVESFRSDSRHGVYARQIWRVCYERAYSVNREWSIPVPIPDNSKLVARIRTWLSST
ncbi:hypothetical protein FRC12_011665 [Ceratobasidium sp. 428]|nr:hypothetical protein FRC12_011665 [Ceratobasidium sp. 428]